MLELLARRADKHIAHEQSMICTRADHADVDPVALVPSCETVDHVDSAPCVEVVDSTFSVNLPDLCAAMLAYLGHTT